jgi:uncharacterized membrane protein
MESFTQPPTERSLFELQIDTDVMTSLRETARWAKFLAITGLITSGLLTVLCIGTGIYTISGGRGEREDNNSTFMGLGYLAATALLMFVPSLYLNSFASRMQRALRTNDQEQLIGSFRSLKACYRFMGILVLIYLGLIILFILFNIFGKATHT